MASGHMSEHTLLINIPNWHGADRLAMYKRSRWVEPETQLEQILFQVIWWRNSEDWDEEF